jgi:hypothetical protein
LCPCQGALGVMPGSEIPATIDENDFDPTEQILMEQYLMYEAERKGWRKFRQKLMNFWSK